MTLSPLLLGLSLFVLLLISILAVVIATYIKERNDAVKLKKVLSRREESILQHTTGAKEQEGSRFLQKIADRLTYAGLEKVGPWFFLGMVLLAAVTGMILFYMVFENILAIAMGGVTFGAIPFAVVNRRIETRIRKFNEALSEAMSVVVRMMRNGVGFEVALKRAVEISQSKLFQSLFARYLREKDVLSEERAFENMFRYVDSAELKIFGLAILIGKSSGGKFSNTLEKLEQSIKQRVLLQKKVTVATREAKVGSYMIVGLLIFIFFILDSNFDGKIIKHFFHTKDGKFEMLLILMWVGFGLLINEKLTKVKS